MFHYWYNRSMAKKAKKPSPARDVPASLTCSPTETLQQKLARLERENAALRKENDDLEHDRGHPKKSSGLLREGKRVKFAFIHAEKAYFPVAALCRVLGRHAAGLLRVRASARRAARVRARPSSARAIVQVVHDESRGTYGSPRVLRELRRRGHARRQAPRRARACAAWACVARTPRRFRVTTQRQSSASGRAERARARLHRDAPERALGHRHHVRLDRRGLVLPRRHPRPVLARRRRLGARRDALDAACRWRRSTWRCGAVGPTPGLLHHSDRGCQYTSADYRAALAEHGIDRQHEPQGQLLGQRRRRVLLRHAQDRARPPTPLGTRARAARSAVFEYIEVFYNRRRLHSSLDYKTPAEVEHEYAQAA